MAEGDLAATELGGQSVEDPAPQAGAERAVCIARIELLGDDAVGVLVHHAKIVARGEHVVAQKMAWIAGMTLIDVHRHKRERDWRPLGQRHEQVMHRVAVLASRNGDEDAISLRDHLKILDGARHRPRQAPFGTQRLGSGHLSSAGRATRRR
jgi:hypothetical protein